MEATQVELKPDTENPLLFYLEGAWKESVSHDVHKAIEKKGKFSYLSWSIAIEKLRHFYPLSTFGWVDFLDDNKNVVNYLKTDLGYFVRAWVKRHPDSPRFEFDHPVLGMMPKIDQVTGEVILETSGKRKGQPQLESNQPLDNPNAFDINTSRQRALSKVISIESGIGLSIYAGEDLVDNFVTGGIPASADDIDRLKKLIEDPILKEPMVPGAKSPYEIFSKKLHDDDWSRSTVATSLKSLTAIIEQKGDQLT